MAEILKNKPYKRNISDIDLKDILKKLYYGCIYFIYDYNDNIKDVHIFIIKDGDIISNIYTDGELWGVYGDTEVAYDTLQDDNKKTLIYIIKNEKIIGQLCISKDSIKVSGDTKKTYDILNKNKGIILDYCSEVDSNDSQKKIKHVIRLTKDKIREFKKYLEEDRYYLVNIHQSVLKISRNGYVVYKGKTPVMAAYEDNYGVLFGKISCNKIKKLLKGNISTVEIYEYSDDFVNLLLDRYPEMRVDVNNISKIVEETIKDTVGANTTVNMPQRN
ncbi:hypothetical protein KKP97_02040 [Methanothermococcus sp. SCGC AD-155-C09]|nr:hypothetical protein [Methanothermococcus sp. SCGC AD-155-C09]